MALNALVDLFFQNQKKVWDWKGSVALANTTPPVIVKTASCEIAGDQPEEGYKKSGSVFLEQTVSGV